MRKLLLPCQSLILVLTVAAGCDAPTPDRTRDVARALDEAACTDASGCLGNLSLQGGQRKLPYYRTHSLTDVHPDIDRAIVVVHGTNRDADVYFQDLVDATTQAGALDHTAVFAPRFLCSTDHPGAGEMSWTCQGWKDGADAVGAAGPFSSCEVIDHLIAQLGRVDRFPALKTIIITGHSAGAQMVQRCAAATHATAPSGVALRYVIANPSTYLYFDPLRMDQGGTCDESGACTAAFVPFYDAASCPDYDLYKYGLTDRNRYFSIDTGMALRDRYVANDMTYLVGDEDVLAHAGTIMDQTCPANAQGIDRRERALVYWSYMTQVHGASHPLSVVPTCRHNAKCMYSSAEAAGALF